MMQRTEIVAPKLSSESGQILSGEACILTGWANAALCSAYMEIEGLLVGLGQPADSGIAEALKRVLDAIDAADTELGSAALTMPRRDHDEVERAR